MKGIIVLRMRGFFEEWSKENGGRRVSCKPNQIISHALQKLACIEEGLSISNEDFSYYKALSCR